MPDKSMLFVAWLDVYVGLIFGFFFPEVRCFSQFYRNPL